MRVLLMQSKYSYSQQESLIPLLVGMPLGLCYLAAVLREHGHEVKILDCLAEGYTQKEIKNGLITFGLSDEEIIKRIKEFSPDVVGCSALFSIQYRNVKNLCRIVKGLNKKIFTVVGGMHATVQPSQVLSDKNIDFVIRGEADYTFTELVNDLENGKNYSKIDGIGYKDKKGIHIREKKKFIQDLDKIPFPARDLLNIEKYFKAGLSHGVVLKGKRNINLITSRGCPGGCTFCTIHLLWGRRFRFRSPQIVLNELKQVKKDFQADHLQFEDDNLTFDIPRAKNIFREMIRAGLNFKWNTPNGIALWRLDKETLKLMKKSGCYFVKFAVESANQRVLTSLIKKPQDLNKLIPLINYARKIGMKVGSFFVVGLPGETKEEMQDSFDFPRKVKLDWVEYSIVTPHYGTELRKICERKGFLKKHNENDLFTRKGIIQTPDFSSSWLEKKMVEENQKYFKFLLFHQPSVLMMQGWETFRRSPTFAFKYLFKIFK